MSTGLGKVALFIVVACLLIVGKNFYTCTCGDLLRLLTQKYICESLSLNSL